MLRTKAIPKQKHPSIPNRISLSSFTSCFEPETLAHIPKFLPWAEQTGIWKGCVSHLLACPIKTSHAWSFVLFSLPSPVTMKGPWWKTHKFRYQVGAPESELGVAYPWSGALTPDNEWQWNGIYRLLALGFGNLSITAVDVTLINMPS